jgi:hypothetical protein
MLSGELSYCGNDVRIVGHLTDPVYPDAHSSQLGSKVTAMGVFYDTRGYFSSK